MAQRRINTIRVLFAGLSAAGAVIVACEAPEPFRGRNPGTLFGGAGGTAGLGNGVGGGTAGAAGLVGAGGRDQGGEGGDSNVGGGTGSFGSAGGTLAGGPGGDGGGGHAATGGIAAGGSAEGGAPAAGGAPRPGVGGAGGKPAGSAGGAAGSPTTGAGGMGGSSSCAACVLSIQCRNYAPTDVTAMNAEIWIANTGTTALPLSQIKVRYYYVNEGGPMALEIFDKAFRRPDGTDARTSPASSFSMTTGKLTSPRMDFSDIAIGGNDVLAGTVPFYFKMSIHDQAHSPLNLSNDYSNGPTTIGPCPHIVAFFGTALAAGSPPG